MNYFKDVFPVFQTICKLRLKFAYQSEQAFVTVTVGTIGWIRYSLWPKLGLFVIFVVSFLFVCETLNDRAMLGYARCDCSTLTRESRTFPNSSCPISPNGIGPEMFLSGSEVLGFQRNRKST